MENSSDLLLKSRVHSAGETNIFSEIGYFSDLHRAVNLAQNAPDYDFDPRLKNFMIEAIDVDMNPYASEFVHPLLLESIKDFNLKRERPLTLTDSEISIVPGSTYGLYIAFTTFIEPGDEIIIIEPGYDTYIPAVEIRHARPVFVPLDDDFNIDFNRIKEAITEKTRAIIVNTPHNPSGKMWTAADWDSLWEIIKDGPVMVISDEVYDLIYYDDHTFCSAYEHPGIRERCFCIYSFEKMFHVSGWKASYVVSSPANTRAFRNIHQYLCFTINYHSQYAVARYLQVFDIHENRRFFERKRNLLLQLTAGLPLTVSEKTAGGYAQIFSFAGMKPEMSDRECSLWLIEHAGVASIPVSAFYHDYRNTGKIRLSFAKKDETLHKAAENLHKFFKY
ncbi:aminotransferase class I/II-fold pyridoxal phosphate-dependent enzyme [Chryseobacterium sp. MFBS3-17]|uniref:aminotransferase class I/II-fold pyridoxal phosphate-dependent enzyme n=1 Tax=Chryseobacterium sp. MFBS3-17 TaxID=2886689 RepID=UPI001D0E8113|nr:aminotransferase class I/II-fold pyridoxal phosphate-dependent enzyme [Chryseobacterium sp. MFBS3-17]MCC2591689.1 aminotransferase class I/II-fold pyridoxal phosphate-dependent enzyme [Chryseobacterium sp. MFBS3-17]